MQYILNENNKATCECWYENTPDQMRRSGGSGYKQNHDIFYLLNHNFAQKNIFSSNLVTLHTFSMFFPSATDQVRERIRNTQDKWQLTALNRRSRMWCVCILCFVYSNWTQKHFLQVFMCGGSNITSIYILLNCMNDAHRRALLPAKVFLLTLPFYVLSVFLVSPPLSSTPTFLSPQPIGPPAQWDHDAQQLRGGAQPGWVERP